MKSLILKILNIDLINTIRFNHYYFGWKAIFRPIALLSAEVQLRCLRGELRLQTREKCGLLTIGLNHNGMTPKGTSAWENSGTIILKGPCHCGVCSKILNAGTLVIGGPEGDVRLNGNVSIICREKIEIGPRTTISWNSLIMDTDFHHIYRKSDHTEINPKRPVYIGKHCWIGYQSLILKGAHIPDGSIIAAGSVVTKPLTNKDTIYVSNMPIKQDVEWDY